MIYQWTLIVVVVATLSTFSSALTPGALSPARLAISGNTHLPPYSSYLGGYNSAYRLGYASPSYHHAYPGYAYRGNIVPGALAPRIAAVAPSIQPQIRPDFESPKPYNFGFAANTEDGAVLNRQEDADGSGAVRGSYGYTDASGLYRQVDYVADALGFRANVRTNEPGTANESPADVTVQADPVTVQHGPVAPARATVLHGGRRVAVAPYLNTVTGHSAHADRLGLGYNAGYPLTSDAGYYSGLKSRYYRPALGSPYYNQRHY